MEGARPSIDADFAALAKVHDGEFSVVSRDRADSNWIVDYVVDDGPVSYYAYDRKSGKAAFLFVNRPELQQYALARMKPVVIPARDGLRSWSRT